jgi:hypothetical protein
LAKEQTDEQLSAQDLENLRKLKEKEIDRLAAISRTGEEMENWVRVNFEFLNDKILKKLEWDAFLAQKDPSFNVEDRNQAHQQVALMRAIDLIRKEMDRQIQAGVDARAAILTYSTQAKEGEQDGNTK